MSRLEKFIDENRNAFDDMEPPGRAWEKIHQAIKKKSVLNFSSGYFARWVAAAVVIIILSATAFLLLNKKENGDVANVRNRDTTVTDLVSNTPEHHEMNQFAGIISVKQAELKLLAREQPELYKRFTSATLQLDSSYNILKNQISVTPNRELLIEAMIQNLQLQLDILNQQLSIIKQIKQSKKYSHEKNKSFT